MVVFVCVCAFVISAARAKANNLFAPQHWEDNKEVSLFFSEIFKCAFLLFLFVLLIMVCVFFVLYYFCRSCF